jgi:hypothetical protein
MVSTSLQRQFNALFQPNTDPRAGPAAGDAASSSGSGGDSNAGAAGADTGSISLSRGGVIAIIVVACSICVFGGIPTFRSSLECETKDLQLCLQSCSILRRSETGKSARASENPQEKWLLHLHLEDQHSQKMCRGENRVEG